MTLCRCRCRVRAAMCSHALIRRFVRACAGSARTRVMAQIGYRRDGPRSCKPCPCRVHRHLRKAGRRGSTASRRGRHHDIRAVQGTAGLHGRGRDREASLLKESQQEIGLARRTCLILCVRRLVDAGSLCVAATVKRTVELEPPSAGSGSRRQAAPRSTLGGCRRQTPPCRSARP